MGLLDKVFGTYSQREVKKIRPLADKVIALEDEYRKKTLKQVVDKYFDNSYTRVVSTLIEEEALTLDELQELIQQIKNK